MTECTVQRDLAAFVDGELRGASVLDVLRHLEECPECAAEVEQLKRLGDTIRSTMPYDAVPAGLDGLASTVVSRTRAESAQSWPGMFRRAQEDWHWVIVGSGSIAATLVSTLLLSAILAFGPKPDRADSLSAFYTNFRAPAGDLYLLATPAGQNQEPVWMKENGGPAARGRIVPAWLVTREASLVGALQDAVTDGEQTVALSRMSPQRRQLTESLLSEISRYRMATPMIPPPPGSALTVHEVRLEAFATVTVKGL